MFKRGLQFGTGAGVALLMTAIVYAVASYPSAVISFPVRANGQTIDASWFNLVYDEVMALESGLIDGLAHDLKFIDGLYDIGKSGATRPRDLFLSRNATVGGTLAATGATTLSSTLGVTGAITATGGQILFPATQVPAAGANTLDDYEEGAWTPVIGGAGGTTGQTYGTQVGRYVKIGKHVMATGHVVLTGKGTITGAVILSGLPFAGADTADDLDVGILRIGYFTGMTTNWITLGGHANGNQSNATVYGSQAAATASVGLLTADISNTTGWIFSVDYEAAN